MIKIHGGEKQNSCSKRLTSAILQINRIYNDKSRFGIIVASLVC